MMALLVAINACPSLKSEILIISSSYNFTSLTSCISLRSIWPISPSFPENTKNLGCKKVTVLIPFVITLFLGPILTYLPVLYEVYLTTLRFMRCLHSERLGTRIDHQD
jgi:hypothetical protein